MLVLPLLMFKRYKATMAPLSEQEIQRRQNLESLITYGINPYPAEKYEVSASAQHIVFLIPNSALDEGFKTLRPQLWILHKDNP